MDKRGTPMIYAEKSTEGKTTRCCAAKKELADSACSIITSNIGRHITIAELAERLHVSPTQLKVSFRSVYGMPIYSYSKRQRMMIAARLLVETDDSILKIAGRLGYENGSKFSNAFHSVFGVTPSSYRKQGKAKKEN